MLKLTRSVKGAEAVLPLLLCAWIYLVALSPHNLLAPIVGPVLLCLYGTLCGKKIWPQVVVYRFEISAVLGGLCGIGAMAIASDDLATPAFYLIGALGGIYLRLFLPFMHFARALTAAAAGVIVSEILLMFGGTVELGYADVILLPGSLAALFEMIGLAGQARARRVFLGLVLVGCFLMFEDISTLTCFAVAGLYWFIIGRLRHKGHERTFGDRLMLWGPPTAMLGYTCCMLWLALVLPENIWTGAGNLRGGSDFTGFVQSFGLIGLIIATAALGFLLRRGKSWHTWLPSDRVIASLTLSATAIMQSITGNFLSTPHGWVLGSAFLAYNFPRVPRQEGRKLPYAKILIGFGALSITACAAAIAAVIGELS